MLSNFHTKSSSFRKDLLVNVYETQTMFTINIFKILFCKVEHLEL